ncbi:hypothetical protein CEP52_004607 [Fusarium oligoseptatum]|uniref:Heterokaryon incompatibility domain-containing protein n=1 Tax=Fusarium oligoseptatum TaxID=2604345 RepID=A0A428U2P8_9HYPO|nr:hypothetical protein CEP52_004607 [Fusarium oligoseptatum]
MDRPRPVTVCKACRMLLVPEPNDQTSSSIKPSHRDQQTLKQSVDDGCFVCSRIWERLDPSDEETTPYYKDGLSPKDKPEKRWPRAAILYNRLSHDQSLTIFIDPSVFLRSRGRQACTYFSLRHLDESSATDAVKRLPDSTKSPETLSMAKEWISDCVKNHPTCNHINTETSWYPTRLLDCGSQADADPLCTLVETRTNRLTGPYMTLSHCWGLIDCIKLTTDNYAQMVKGIPSSQLPQLYQDALYVTRSLGVQYLWIDSLCIIQKGDNLVDWNQEVTLMSITSRYLISEDRYWNIEVTRSLLNTRAWVFQERLLAPRILHFGKRHLIWECREKLASDASSDASASILAESGESSGIFLKSSFARLGCEKGFYLKTWGTVVRLYATCKLTFPGDRLIALSALARSMGTLMQDEYVAGMWRGGLELDMLWCIDGFQGASTPTTYRAPTWSWVASVGRVWPAERLMDGLSLIKVEKVHLDYVTEDTWGMLRGGWLHLRGHLKKLSLIHPDDWKMVVNGVQVEGATKYDAKPHVYFDTPESEGNKESEPNLYCMIGRRVTTVCEGLIFVLLLELVDGETGTFKRIGIARGVVKDPEATFISPSEGEDEFPCLEYVDGQHLICII